MQDDHYKTLGISRSATDDEIRKAWKAKVKENHPDQNQGDSGAEQRLLHVNDAYETLKDPVKKAEYDRIYDHRQKLKQEAMARNAKSHAKAPPTSEPYKKEKSPQNQSKKTTVKTEPQSPSSKTGSETPARPAAAFNTDADAALNIAIKGYTKSMAATSRPSASGQTLSKRF